MIRGHIDPARAWYVPRPMRKGRTTLALLAALLLAAALLAASCSGGDDDDATESGTAEAGTLTILAPEPIAEVFRELAPEATFTVAGAEELAAMITDGARADLYAADGRRYPSELAAEGAVDPPILFATDRLVLVVPADNPAGIESVDDLGAPDVELAVADEEAPLGEYTRGTLGDLGLADALAGADSSGGDGRSVLESLSSGEANAGVVYTTDAATAGDAVQVIELPAQALPEYLFSATASTEQGPDVEAFIELVLGADGRQALQEAGFGLPPSGR
jgi:molybdate transport system substrate-binding protein